MPKHRSTAAADPYGPVEGGPPLPDLTGVDLRSLRDLQHPVLSAAVEDVLRHTPQTSDAWAKDGG
ncbi:FxSxx-COOH cyclophane-containing RiPP peptide [Streptomyces sp. NPDC004647]|uniref:FxSxx-COOH cyclophane-containing RiPP peptide n=1 Tax=Streptomyces sp. NPDC004647 TaxID=3154671 RepID=UPI0033B3D828